MANVSFTRGTDATAGGSTATGRLTFNTANGVISLGLGSTAANFETMNRVSATYGVSKELKVTTTPVNGVYNHHGKYQVTVPGILTFMTFSRTGGSASYGEMTHSVSVGASNSGIVTQVTFTSKLTASSLATAPTPYPTVTYHLRYIPCG